MTKRKTLDKIQILKGTYRHILIEVVPTKLRYAEPCYMGYQGYALHRVERLIDKMK